MPEKFIQIDCGERISTKGQHVDFSSSGLDNVQRAINCVPPKSYELSKVRLFTSCPVAETMCIPDVYISLAPNMTMEKIDPDLTTMSKELAKEIILQTDQFVCTPFRGENCPKGFK